MKTFLLVAILSLNGNNEIVVSEKLEKEMPSIADCKALVRQEGFTSNLQKSFPNSVGAFFNCVEIEMGLGV